MYQRLMIIKLHSKVITFMEIRKVMETTNWVLIIHQNHKTRHTLIYKAIAYYTIPTIFMRFTLMKKISMMQRSIIMKK